MKNFDALYTELVPEEGKADTVAGEMLRAAGRIIYRYENDGDKIGVEYGNQTCNAPARYLMSQDANLSRVVYRMWGAWDDAGYEEMLAQLRTTMAEYIESHPELKTLPNTEDMLDYYDAEEDEDWEEDWEYDPADIECC